VRVDIALGLITFAMARRYMVLFFTRTHQQTQTSLTEGLAGDVLYSLRNFFLHRKNIRVFPLPRF
jgi:hypothetical protein